MQNALKRDMQRLLMRIICARSGVDIVLFPEVDDYLIIIMRWGRELQVHGSLQAAASSALPALLHSLAPAAE
jgi:hypothetical protein